MNKSCIKIIIIVCLISGFMASCGGRPSNVLSEDKMVDLLADMQIAEAYQSVMPGASNDDKLETGRKVLEAHGVSEETLDTTLAWYGRNMDEYAALYDKVDQEIIKKQKKYTEIPGARNLNSSDLWPYEPHLIISPLSGYEALVFSFPVSEVDKGDILAFSFYLPNATNMKGTLGVEYTDGYGEAAIVNHNSKNKMKVELHTDSSKTISRIFGNMYVKDDKVFPLYIDSISLKTEPLDSLTYRAKRRSQKNFGPMTAQKLPEPKEVTDTVVMKDSVVLKEKEVTPHTVNVTPEVKKVHNSDKNPDKIKPKKASISR